MIKVWTNKNAKIRNNEIFTKEELSLLETIEIDSVENLMNTRNKITNYLVKKYGVLGLFELDDKKLEKNDEKLYNLEKKIYNKIENLT